jgi:hypothetical protein
MIVHAVRRSETRIISGDGPDLAGMRSRRSSLGALHAESARFATRPPYQFAAAIRTRCAESVATASAEGALVAADVGLAVGDESSAAALTVLPHLKRHVAPRRALARHNSCANAERSPPQIIGLFRRTGRSR